MELPLEYYQSNMFTHELALKFIKYYPFSHFQNRTMIGLAAGFDKNCDTLSHIHKFGFSFVEVGSLTPKENKGNKNAKIKRFDHSIINNLGLPNIGIDKAIPKLERAKPKIPVLANISPLTDSTFQEMQDSVIKIEKLYNISAIILNISCPNILCIEDRIDLIRLKCNKPLFIKLSPGISYNQLEEIVTDAVNYDIDGYILTNSLQSPEGGISGRQLKDFSNNSIKIVSKLKAERQIIIGCGGIETVEDIIYKIGSGAKCVEILTSWILSKNPWYIDNLNKDLRLWMKNTNKLTDKGEIQ